MAIRPSITASTAITTQPEAAPLAPKFIANLLATGASEGIARLTQIGVIALVSRDLGPAGFGIFGIAWSLQQMALAFVQVGPEMIGIRYYGQSQGRRALLFDLIRLKCVVAAISLTVMIGAAILLYGYQSPIIPQTIVQGLVLIPIAAGNGWVLRAASQFSDFAVLRVGQSVLFLLALFAVLKVWPVALAIPATEGAVTVIVSLLIWRRAMTYAVDEHGGPADSERHFRPRTLLHESLALGFTTLCSTLFWTVPVPLGGLFLSPAGVGIVAAVSRLLAALNGLCQMFIQVFYPALVRRYAVDPANGAATAGTLFVLAALASLVLVISLAATAQWIVPLLLGAEAIDAVGLFQYWLTTMIPAATGSIFGYALMATGRVASFTLITTIATVGVVAITALAFCIVPNPISAASGTIAMLGYAAGLGVAAYRAGLISLSRETLRILHPTYFYRFLLER